MKSWRLENIAFVVCLLAFEGVGVKYLDIVFTETTRWGFLLLLGGVLFVRGQLLRPFQTGFGAILAAYCLWCLCTTAWSIVPTLSGLKSIAFVIGSTVFIAAGQAWAANGRRPLLHFLWPILVVALFAGFFDRGAVTRLGSVEIYQGLTGNPNYLGIIIAMSMPLGLWLAYRNWSQPLRRSLSIAIVAALLLALWLAGSRAAFLCVLAISAGFFAAMSTNQRLVVGGLLAASVASLVVLVPEVEHSISVRVINKANSEEGAFYTRKYVWAESYDLAKQGGLLGVGYGATAGQTDLSKRESALSSHGYGREKGNSQLAVWEETGVVGLGFYSLLIIAILAELGGAWRYASSRDQRVQLGLLLGAIVGMLIQSVFEAWWVAPGAPEFAYLFSILGVAAGLSEQMTAQGKAAAALRRNQGMGRARVVTRPSP